MGGMVGRLFREFSVTLAFAIAISTVVSLSLTPMICAHFVKAAPSPNATWLDRAVEAGARTARSRSMRRRSHRAAAPHADADGRSLATIALTVDLYIKTPKGFSRRTTPG